MEIRIRVSKFAKPIRVQHLVGGQRKDCKNRATWKTQVQLMNGIEQPDAIGLAYCSTLDRFLYSEGVFIAFKRAVREIPSRHERKAWWDRFWDQTGFTPALLKEMKKESIR